MHTISKDHNSWTSWIPVWIRTYESFGFKLIFALAHEQALTVHRTKTIFQFLWQNRKKKTWGSNTSLNFSKEQRVIAHNTRDKVKLLNNHTRVFHYLKILLLANAQMQPNVGKAKCFVQILAFLPISQWSRTWTKVHLLKFIYLSSQVIKEWCVVLMQSV